MTGASAPSARVFDIPELAEAVFQFAGLRTIRTLRLVCRLFRDRCSPFFFISLDLANPNKHPDLKQILDSATGSPTPEDERGILDHIHSIKLNERVLSKAVFSTPLACFLNQCRNIQHIYVDDPRSAYMSTRSAPSDPLLLWPDLTDLAPSDCSIFSCLPLGGTLLSRLESLTIAVSIASPLNMDGFFIRLGQSRAAQTLCSLVILGNCDRMREFSFDAFQECVSALKSLETLRIKHMRIQSGTQTQPVLQALQLRLRLRHDSCVAIKVRTLDFSGHIPPEFRLPFMDLFPNVESLGLEHGDQLLDMATEQQVFGAENLASIFPNTALCTSWTTLVRSSSSPLNVKKVISFPRLKALGEHNLSCRFWTSSRFLQDWIERQPGFQLITLHLQPHHASNAIPYVTRFFGILTEKAVSTKNLYIETRNEYLGIAALLSDFCRKLEGLKIKIEGGESSAILLAAFKSSKRTKSPPLATLEDQTTLEDQPILNPGFCREDLLHHFPWTGTLTRLSLSSGVDSRLDVILEPGCLDFMRSILRFSPHLVDFEMFEWITDLALFNGLGRAPLTSKNDIAASAEKDTFVCSYEDERPHLRRLVLFQLQQGSEKQLSWRAQLKYRFRYLEELVI